MLAYVLVVSRLASSVMTVSICLRKLLESYYQLFGHKPPISILYSIQSSPKLVSVSFLTGFTLHHLLDVSHVTITITVTFVFLLA